MESRTSVLAEMSLLPEVLGQLLQELMQIRDGVRPAVALHPTSPERWEDEEFIYMEADLHGEPGADIDICIHSGRAFIRMERSPAGPRYLPAIRGDGSEQ